MAKVAGPLHSTNAVGRFAGSHVYNQWRGIQYCKKLTAPAQPQTARQLLIRGFLAQLSIAWGTLTAAQRAGWQTWADQHQPNDPQFNRPIPWSGMNAYVALNTLLLDLGETAVATAPVVAGPDPPAAFAAVEAIGDVTITWTATAGTNMACDIWKVSFLSPARNPNVQLFKHLDFADGETGTYTDTAPGAGTHHYLGRIISEDDGQSSTYERVQVTMA